MSEPQSFIGRKQCGCVVAACVDDGKHKRDTAKFVAKLIRDGLSVEKVDTQYVREHFTRCLHDAAIKPQRQARLL